MTKAQTLTIKLSECRQRTNELLGIDARTDEQQAEMERITGEIQAMEPELRAAIAAEPDPQTQTTDTGDPEIRERLELRSKARLGGFLLAALQGRLPNGPEAEYAASCGAADGGVPLDLFEQDRPALAPETRATTPAPTTGAGVTVAPIQPFVFSESIAPMLGIDMPQVPSGSYSEMTISTALTVNPEPKGDAADGTAAALTPVTAAPRRISARLSLAIEDLAAVGQANFEAALRQHTTAALSNQYDNQCINGNGTSPNVEGLVDQLTDPTNPTAAATFALFLAAFANAIDGLWASKLADVKIVTNADAYKLAATVFRGNSADQHFADYARQGTGGFSCNSRMPATASTIARGIVYRMGRPGLRTACHPVWGTISIDDIYTDSASGARHFSVHVLVGDKVLLVQPSAYGLVEFKVA